MRTIINNTLKNKYISFMLKAITYICVSLAIVFKRIFTSALNSKELVKLFPISIMLIAISFILRLADFNYNSYCIESLDITFLLSILFLILYHNLKEPSKLPFVH